MFEVMWLKMKDYVIPNKNEKKFIEIAKKLGYSEICFLYPLAEFEAKLKNPEKYDTKIKVNLGVLCTAKDMAKARAKISKVKNDLKLKQLFSIVLRGTQERKVFEAGGVVVFDVYDHGNKDFLHHRNIGFNQVLAKLANKNNVTIGFSLGSVLYGDRRKLFARITENIRFCKKYKVEVVFASLAKHPYEMRNYADLRSLFRVLGKK